MKDSVKSYKPKLAGNSRDPLFDLAADLDFYVDHIGVHYGRPAAVEMLNALAAAYRANPTAVAAALRGLGIVGEGKPPER